MVLSRMYDSPGTWLDSRGPEADIVISSRIRLARNVNGFPFVNRMENTTRSEFVEFLLKHIDDVVQEYGLGWVDIDKLDPIDLQLLFERHLISSEIVNGTGCRGILVNSDENIAIMVNEEDHLRIQYLGAGLQLGKIWQQIDRLDDRLDGNVEFAFDPRLGYLTSCPTNIGTGIRVSVMLHLPGLAITDQMKKVFNAVSKMGLTVRGMYGEGTEGIGDFYQISNQITLGAAENEIIVRLNGVLPRIIAYERKARETLLVKRKALTEDRIWRAWGVLSNARSLSSQEALTLLSLIRLGIGIGVITDLDIGVLNRLFLQAQPSHLQKRQDRLMDAAERDALRAEYIRGILQGN